MWLIIILIIQCVIGALLSLPALLPPVRKIGQNSKRVRVTKSLIFGLLTVVIMIGGYTWLGSYVRITLLNLSVHPYYSQLRDVQEEIAANRSAIATELWLRRLSPLDHPCYARRMTVCDLANRIESDDELYCVRTTAGTPFKDGLYVAVLFVVPGVVTGAMVWGFSRPALSPPSEDVEANVKKIFQQISNEEK